MWGAVFHSGPAEACYRSGFSVVGAYDDLFAELLCGVDGACDEGYAVDSLEVLAVYPFGTTASWNEAEH